ncbi:MAG: hypothetical protein QOH88_1336 [Verrucomicrobiota bacterium]|jgi:sugar lactone lactonase YvrE
MKSKNSSFAAFALFAATIVLAAGGSAVHAGGVALDAAGNLFVAERSSVSKFTTDGTKSTLPAGLKNPLGLTFDAKGNLFVSDIETDSIYKFAPDGKKSTFAPGIHSFGMACDSSGNLFVSHENSIFKFTPAGKKSTFVSGLGNAIDLAFDEAGNLFVVEQAIVGNAKGRSILKFSPDGTKSTFASGLDNPSDVATDKGGNFYVTDVTAPDASTHAILKFSPDGTKSTFTSAAGAARGSGLAVDSSGNVYLASEHAILKFDPSGTPSTFASDWISPDKQWEYRCAEGQWPEIVKAGTNERVLNLLEDQSAPHAGDAEVLWAPDSKRFAFNYSPPHRPHSSYDTIALYQLRGDKWVKSHLPVDKASERAQLVQLAGAHFPKNAVPRGAEPIRDILKVRGWIDASSATLYAYSRWEGGGSHDTKAAFVFTLKFDAEGNSKIVKTERVPDKEIED